MRALIHRNGIETNDVRIDWAQVLLADANAREKTKYFVAHFSHFCCGLSSIFRHGVSHKIRYLDVIDDTMTERRKYRFSRKKSTFCWFNFFSRDFSFESGNTIDRYLR